MPLKRIGFVGESRVVKSERTGEIDTLAPESQMIGMLTLGAQRVHSATEVYICRSVVSVFVVVAEGETRLTSKPSHSTLGTDSAC